jgi:UDP-N-acetylglucosamine 1-carboxyvinyltransferase
MYCWYKLAFQRRYHVFIKMKKGIIIMPQETIIKGAVASRVVPSKKKPSYLEIEQSLKLEGQASLNGAKNAALVIIASLILTKGKSTLFHVPASDDVYNMIELMTNLGAEIRFNPLQNILEVDTTHLVSVPIGPEITTKMRASILVLGPLLARFGKAELSQSGGCVIGERPIDYHLKNFKKMGVTINEKDEWLTADVKKLQHRNLLLEYPSVGATENLVMAAVLTEGTTKIINAALEPEVFDFLEVLKKMGAQISIEVPATIRVDGVKALKPIQHEVIFDRLEAGALLLAGAITGGYIHLPEAPAHSMGLFLTKLQDMGHTVLIGKEGIGVKIKGARLKHSLSIKTAPYPSFPTDLQAPIMAALTLVRGTSKVQETVFENRMMHVRELVKMGAQIDVEHGIATIRGVDELFGTTVIASDIRASCCLVLAGLAAKGTTTVTGVHHWRRGYQNLEKKLRQLGASIELVE